MQVLRAAGWLVLLFAAALAVHPARAATADRSDAAIAAMLASARAEAAQGCDRPSDRLVAVLCAGRLVVGVRSDYPNFSLGVDGGFAGYEADIGRALAARMGVQAVFRRVTPAGRIAAVGDGQVDLVIATMGHTSQRDGQARFIRPHYFQSRTIVVGPHLLRAADWHDIAGDTVCVTVGNAVNAELSGHGARLMLFDGPRELADALRLGTCRLAAQDDSFFASAFADPEFAARFGSKFSVAPLPWGMAVARSGADRLATLLDMLSLDMHRHGAFLALAERWHLPLDFLQTQQGIWRAAECVSADGTPAPACLAEPVDSALPPTRFAARVEAVETWLQATIGLDVSLPMLKTRPALVLFRDGLENSLVLVAGALAATFALTLAMAAALTARRRLVRLPVRALTLLLQSSPIVLLLFLGYFTASALAPYSVKVAMVVAVLVLGLYNASYAGPAVAEASRALSARAGRKVRLAVATRHAGSQVLAFLVNAAKGSSIASVIGVPELLDSLTDIASFSSERATTFTVLLLFYSAVVGLVVWGGEAVRRRLDAARPAA